MQRAEATALKSTLWSWRQWLLRAAALGVALLLLVAVEGMLRHFGYGYPTTYFIRSADGRFYISNRQFGWQFFPHESAIIPNPAIFPVRKEPGTRRIFLLGESAAAGSPTPAFGFGRILEAMLEEQYPNQRFEVINAAMRGINSRITLRIAEECAAYEPDLFILYMGNNEFVAYHTAGSDEISRMRNFRLLQFVQRIRSLRLAQLAEAIWSGLHGAGGGDKIVWDMAFFRQRRLAPEDSRRRIIYENFGATLAEVCRVTQRSGTRVILCTVGVNLKDFPPFGSLTHQGQSETRSAAWSREYEAAVAAANQGDTARAIRLFENSERLEGTCAELEFRLARCYLAAGDTKAARSHFIKARDYDALQFRADSQINRTIRQMAAQVGTPRLKLADVEGALAANSPAGIPGEEFFQDHVHFQFDGDYQVAKALVPFAQSALNLGSAARPTLSRDTCAGLLAYTPWDEINRMRPMLELQSKAPFLDQVDHAARQQKLRQQYHQAVQALDQEQLTKSILMYDQAVACRPEDWQLRYDFGYLLESVGDLAGAEEQFARALAYYPEMLAAQLELGFTCLAAGQKSRALQEFVDAVRTDPHSKRAWHALNQALRN